MRTKLADAKKKLTDEKMQIQRSEWEKLKVRIYKQMQRHNM